MWSGTIAFGLVIVPVKLYSAVSENETAFKQVRKSDGSPIKYRRFAAVDEAEVPYADIAKGYEYGNTMLVLTDEDMASLPLPTAKEISVLQFVQPDEVDPIMFNKSYYVAPAMVAAETAYALLRGAMKARNVVAVVKVALRQRESLGVLRAAGDQLILTTLTWPDEIRSPVVHDDNTATDTVHQAMAVGLVDALTRPFDASEHEDGYKAALMQVIEAKAAGVELVTEPAPQPDMTANLFDALQASLLAGGQKS
jgi:DNA end-binding protein Ku